MGDRTPPVTHVAGVNRHDAVVYEKLIDAVLPVVGTLRCPRGPDMPIRTPTISRALG